MNTYVVTFNQPCVQIFVRASNIPDARRYAARKAGRSARDIAVVTCTAFTPYQGLTR
jgi:hypothetical protein